MDFLSIFSILRFFIVVLFDFHHDDDSGIPNCSDYYLVPQNETEIVVYFLVIQANIHRPILVVVKDFNENFYFNRFIIVFYYEVEVDNTFLFQDFIATKIVNS